jgi:endothelin-converting enzyme
MQIFTLNEWEVVSHALVLDRAQPVSVAEAELFSKIRSAYDSCLDMDQIRASDVSTLRALIAFIGENNNKTSSLSNSFMLLQSMGIESIISRTVEPDDKDPIKTVIKLAPSRSLGLPAAELYRNQTVLNMYREVILKVMPAVIGAEPSSLESYEAIVELESAIVNILPPRELLDNITVSAPTYQFWLNLIVL